MQQYLRFDGALHSPAYPSQDNVDLQETEKEKSHNKAKEFHLYIYIYDFESGNWNSARIQYINVLLYRCKCI